MHQTKNRDTGLRNRIRSSCGVGLVQEIITGETIHNIIVVGIIYTVHRRHKLLEMLVKVFHISMQNWITNRQSIMHLPLKWTVSFVIKLFIF